MKKENTEGEGEAERQREGERQRESEWVQELKSRS